MITKLSYDYWIETQNCPLSGMPQDQAASIYTQLGQKLVEGNPAESAFPRCGFEDSHTVVDVSHASCVYEQVYDYPDGTPERYEYHQCPGGGLCYERYSACYECIYGQAPDGSCNPAPPGMPDRKLAVTMTDSWNTGYDKCGTYDAPWGTVSCMPVCNSDAPGPGLGMAHANGSPTFVVDAVQGTPQQTMPMEHEHETR